MDRWKEQRTTMISYLLRLFLKAILAPSVFVFERKLTNPKKAQDQLLKKIIRSLPVSGIREDYTSFKNHFPVITYDEIQGKEDQWISEPVLFYEMTSGSSGVSKLIPYTQSLKKSFTRMFCLWMYNLLDRGPEFCTGVLYMSVSPSFARSLHEYKGVPVGLDNDAEYLSGWIQSWIKKYLAVPSTIQKIRDPNNFKRVLGAYLIACEDLEIISIWNPTFFLVVLDHLKQEKSQLIQDLKTGVIEVEELHFSLPSISSKRIELIENPSCHWEQIWPRLKMISCWTNAHALFSAERLAREFPSTWIQGKGLLATEAPLTLPWIQANGCLPMIDEVFYEFIDSSGKILRLHELQLGKTYSVIISQKGGLMRYRIGDQILVENYYQETPCLSFVNREGTVSDLVGEKLNEEFLRSSLKNISKISGAFDLILPQLTGERPPHYLWLTDRFTSGNDLDEELQKSFHYRYARQIGQLGPMRVLHVQNGHELLLQFFSERGMKMGNMKDRLLICDLKLAESLALLFNDEGICTYLNYPQRGTKAPHFSS